MATLPGPYDMILADLPYGSTACRWDTRIPFAPLWEQYKRLIKRKGAVVLFGSQPFTSALVMSNVEWFRHSWVWEKDKAPNFMQAKRQPLNYHEDVIVFAGAGQPDYGPIMWDAGRISNRNGSASKIKADGAYNHLAEHSDYTRETTQRYPRSVLRFNTCKSNDGINGCLHPTQKPVALLEYLIRTYTNEGETVLDNTMGSGSTGVACVNTGRSFVGIEMDAGYFEIAETRIAKAQAEMVQARLSV